MVSNAEIIDYVSARIITDLDFLTTHGFISRDDQNVILSRLPSNNPAPQTQRAMAPVSMPNPTIPSFGAPNGNQSNQGMMPSTSFPLKQVGGGSPTNSKRAVPPAPAPAKQTPDFCRASWDYNADMSVRDSPSPFIVMYSSKRTGAQ